MRLPAEWEPHELTIMGWPCRVSLWGETLEPAREDYATVARAIARFEPVVMIANPGSEADAAREACGDGVRVVELPIDDSWLRDSGPIYVRGERPRGEREAVHFRFNAWGEKFPPWDRDAAIGGRIARELGDAVREVDLVLEGGSIVGNGEGVLLSTEQCLLHPSRNPGLTREEIEGALTSSLGIETLVWLGQGLIEDRDTDGHVDLIAAFVDPQRVLLQTVPVDDPNWASCEENRRRVQEAGLGVVELPWLPRVTVAGEAVAASYLNLYICNGAVIVPVCGAASDDAALGVVADAFPDREIVPVPGAVIAYGGGGPHCITQQVPTRYE